MNRQRLFFALLVLLLSTGADIAIAQVYKWTDASGQVHYGQKKPDDAAQVQTLDIASPPPVVPTTADSAAEIARIKALSEQMARERQATEQARQEKTIRDLEQANQQLKNDLLNQQLQERQQQETNDSDRVILDYPPLYPYPYPAPYPRPHPPYPPHQWPCKPWPACRQSTPPGPPPPAPTPPPPALQVKPAPPLHPKPVGVSPAPEGFFRGR